MAIPIAPPVNEITHFQAPLDGRSDAFLLRSIRNDERSASVIFHARFHILYTQTIVAVKCCGEYIWSASGPQGPSRMSVI